ncbi:hypothetical protein JKP88DRAFT_201232 [Tribonema minus]|uniref:Strictosidine synthase conserved region domain-containing protein n=1 Tax=Tribonema minus TaxID=303371 RepID=A0A835YS31_9STRA|nr:hypothetical protein JKP88DRAFT_201232 [Tribonema minus]
MGGQSLLLLAIAVAALGYMVGKRISKSPLEPFPWSQVPSPPSLHGALAPNEVLINAELLHVNETVGPEAFALGADGSIYTGLADGRVVMLNDRGEDLRTVFFVGGFLSSQCREAGAKTGLEECGKELRAECSAAARARNRGASEDTERRCGRPLGLQFVASNATLYVLDAYHGLFALDVSARHAARQLFDAASTVPEPAAGGARAHRDTRRPVRFLNDLALAPDGTFLITDSSWKHARFNNRLEILDAAPRGRLLRFDPADGSLKTLLCGLHFANGVVIRNGTTALIAESLRFRVLEVPLAALSADAGDASATAAALTRCSGAALPPHVRVLAANLPGFADNLEESAPGGGGGGGGAATLLIGVGTRAAKPFSLLHYMFWLPPAARSAVVALLGPVLMERLIPRYGLVLELNAQTGEVQASYHDPTGRVPFVSTALRHPTTGYLFLGSSQNPFLARVRAP